jgi:hypothetical protein
LNLHLPADLPADRPGAEDEPAGDPVADSFPGCLARASPQIMALQPPGGPVTVAPNPNFTAFRILRTMGNLKKKRRLKMNKHKRRKRLKANRHKKRTWQK